eukprot:2212338-Pleurochrysis_carterae.AAC.1
MIPCDSLIPTKWMCQNKLGLPVGMLGPCCACGYCLQVVLLSLLRKNYVGALRSQSSSTDFSHTALNDIATESHTSWPLEASVC